MKNILPVIATLSCCTLQAQYYFNDIIGTGETNRQMNTYLANKVQTVSAKGYNPQGVITTDFSESQEIMQNGTLLKISTRNPNTTILYYRYNNKGILTSITDSSGNVQSITTYEYDAAGRISTVQNNLKDTANDFNQTEVHRWSYNADGKPATMWRTINNADSMEVRFMPDENGNTGDERMYKRGVETGVVYYYYDDKNRLTDIVRYNAKARRLLPDYMFEYDDNNRVIQKITTTSSLNLSYLIWRYLFNEKGLKTKEALFNKNKELTGKIEYSYTFGQ